MATHEKRPLITTPARAAGESAMDYLRRVVNHHNYEHESLLDHFETTEGLIEYFELQHAYGTEFWDGIIEQIADGYDAEPARQFIRRHKLPVSFRVDVSEAARLAKKGGTR